jgi:hypothetical protein
LYVYIHVCMYVCMYVYIYIYIYTHTHTHTHSSILAFSVGVLYEYRARIWISCPFLAYIYVYIYIHINTHTHTCRLCVCLCVLCVFYGGMHPCIHLARLFQDPRGPVVRIRNLTTPKHHIHAHNQTACIHCKKLSTSTCLLKHLRGPASFCQGPLPLRVSSLCNIHRLHHLFQ